MGEFNSRLLDYLYEAADISYNPNQPDEKPIPGTPFRNIDARRMDQMKTAVMRIILRRARNFMLDTKQDVKNERERIAIADFMIAFTTENVEHTYVSDEKESEDKKSGSQADKDVSSSEGTVDKPLALVETFPFESYKGTRAKPAPSEVNLRTGTNPQVLVSSCDTVDGKKDTELACWIDLFSEDLMIGGFPHERLVFSCVPPKQG